MLADRERHMPAGATQLVRKLQPGRRCAYDEHAARIQLSGIAVLFRCQRRHRLWQCGGNRRDAWNAMRSARHDDRAALPLAAVGYDSEALIGLAYRRHRRAGFCRCAHESCVAVNEFDHFAHWHIPVRLGAGVAVSGQAALPIRRQQAQRIPSLAPPRIADLAALQHNVIDRVLRQASAHRES